MKKTILTIALLIPSLAMACVEPPAPECNVSCVEHSVTIHEQGEEVEQFTVAHIGETDFSSIIDKGEKENVTLHAKKRKEHCTDPVVYDGMLNGLGTQEFAGFYLDQDGQTIWGPKRERYQRCLSVDLSKKPKGDGYHYAKHAAQFKTTDSWVETLTISRHWDRFYESVERICSITSNDSGSNTSPVPEPATILLFGMGVAGIGLVGRKCGKPTGEGKEWPRG